MNEADPPLLWYYALGSGPVPYEGGFATREEAVSVGLTAALGDYSNISIILARHGKLRADVFDADHVIDALIDLNDDQTDEDGDLKAVGATKGQKRDLECVLERALESWLIGHGYAYSSTLSDVHEEQTLVVPASQPEEDTS